MASRSYSVCVACLRSAVGRTLCRGVSTAASPQTSVDILKGKPHRKHDGVSNLKTLRLPEELHNAARSIIHRAQVKQLSDHSKKLTNYLWSRKRLVDVQTLRKKAVSLEKEMWEKAVHSREEMDEQEMQDRIQRKVFSELRRTTYRWTPLRYDEKLGVVYIASRLAGGYAAVKRTLNEIKKRDPTFAPQTLLDFGSGLGTVAWASHSFWGDSLKELVCVDSSGPMSILAERLLNGDDEQAKPHIKNVYFRHFLPVSPKVQFDLVVAAFTLSELQTAKDREDAVFTLWRKTHSYLVLIESGTMEGHQMLMEARDTLLKKKETIVHDPRPASVFAPCSHELGCPKLAQRPFLPCNFQQNYHPLQMPGHNNCQTEKFSYLIMKRAEPAEAEAESEGEGQGEGVDWVRLIAPVLRRTRHVHCQVCCSDGQLQHLVVTPRKHGRDMYRCARSSEWGDKLPVIQRTEEGEDEDDEIQKDGDAE